MKPCLPSAPRIFSSDPMLSELVTSTTLTGLRTKQIKINNDIVDVTNSDSAGRWRELLTGAGTRSVEVTGAGVPLASAIEKTTLNVVMAGGALTTDLVVPGVGTFTGVFVY